MYQLILPITSLLTGVGTVLLGTGLLNTILALRGNIEGYSAGVIGLIMSGYFVGFFCGTFIALPLIRRVGHIRTFAFCGALLSCSALLHILLVNPFAWFFIRILTGVAIVIMYTVIEGWLNGQTPPEQRGRVFSIYMITNLAALAAAQQLLHLGSLESFTLFAISALFISLSITPLALTRLAQPQEQDITRMKIPEMYATAPVAVMASLLSGLIMGAFWGMSAVYADRIGLNEAAIATFMTCAILGGLAGQIPLGKFSDTHDRQWVLIVICILAIIFAGLMALLSLFGQWVLLGMALFGSVAFALYPVAVVHLLDHLPREQVLAGSAGLLLLHGLGAAIGPAIAGQMMTYLGPQALPIYFSVLQGFLFLFTLSHVLRRHKTLKKGLLETQENDAQFTAMVRTTPTVMELIPEHTEAAPEETEEIKANGEIPEEAANTSTAQ